MIIESTGTPALYLGFTLLVVILLAVDFLGYLGSVIFGVFGIFGVRVKTHWKAQEFWG